MPRELSVTYLLAASRAKLWSVPRAIWHYASYPTGPIAKAPPRWYI